MKRLFILIFLLCSEFASAEHLSFPTIKAVAASVDDFIPSNWKRIGSVSLGDLNKDKLPDAAFVIQTTDTLSELLYNEQTKLYDQEDNSGARILIVLFKNRDGKYHLAFQNNDFILRPSEEGICCDPFTDLKIQNGTLVIPFYGGMSRYKWQNTYVFRFQNNDWYLIGATLSSSSVEWFDSTDVVSSSEEESSYNFITKKVKVVTSEMDKNDVTKSKEEWRAIDIGVLRTLKMLIRPFMWEIEKDVFL
jgi:hypothetical protein